jgi:hypothetical protein
VANWEEVAGFLIDRLHRESILELETSESRKLFDALLTYPDVLRIESYFPADDATGEWLRKSAASAAN